MSHVAIDTAWSVCLFLSVCLLDTIMSCAKTAEPIEMPFRFWTPVGPKNDSLGGAWISMNAQYNRHQQYQMHSVTMT